MEILAPGKFEINLAGDGVSGEAQVITVTLGLRGEIFKILTRKQLAYRQLSSKSLVPDGIRAKISELTERQEQLKNAEEKDQEAIEALQQEIAAAYEEAITVLDSNREQITNDLALSMVDLTDSAIAEMLSLLLSERDEKGRVVNLVTVEEVLYGQKYADCSDELFSLVEAVMDYLISASKKVQAVSQMVVSLVRPD